ncbi:MAG: hypothetical protein ACHQ4G_10335 [Opitutales bacterium]
MSPEHQLRRSLSATDETGARSALLVDDALRLWKRLSRFIAMGLVEADIDRPAVELACFALQLPLRQGKAARGRQTSIGLRDRSEQAAELLLSNFAQTYDANLLERTAHILRGLHQKMPPSPEARLLADAVNLDDFGAIGFVTQAMQLARAQGSIRHLVEAFEKREEYGYWEVRLKDGFHFEVVRNIARKRLENARAMVTRLADELHEDEL